MNPTTHFKVHSGWKILLKDMGLNPAEVLRLAGLPADLFTLKEAWISVQGYYDMWQAMEKMAGERELPLVFGQAISIEVFDAAIYASVCSPNLNQALKRLSMYKKLICPLVLQVNVQTDFTSVTVACHGKSDLLETMSLTEHVFFTQLARLATRERITPKKVVVRNWSGRSAEYADYFGVEPVAGAENRIEFTAEDAQRPFLTENAVMLDFFEPELKKRLNDLEIAASLQEKVRTILLEMLPSGQGTIEQVAEQLAMSSRTLQRKLAAERTSFSRLLQATRKKLADFYLKQSQLSPAEISFLLGFQDTNSFIRAFGSWMGVSPMQYRTQA